MRLIDADKLLQDIEHYRLSDGKFQHWVQVQPTIEPERTGKWIYHSDWEADGECGYECSECGMGSDVDYNYCMRCGCRMLKEGEEHD